MGSSVRVATMRVFSELHKLLIDDDGRVLSFLGDIFQQSSGATAIEYGLIAALIAVAAVSVMGTVGTSLSSTFNTVAGSL